MIACYGCGKALEETKVLYDIDRLPFCSAQCANATYEKWGKTFIGSCPMCGRQILDNSSTKAK